MSRFSKYNEERKKKQSKEITIEDFYNDMTRAKFYTMLVLRQYVLDFDIEKTLNITKTRANKYAEELHNLSLLEYKVFSDLEFRQQEILYGLYDREYKSLFTGSNIVFQLSDYGKKQGKQLFSHIVSQYKETPVYFDFVKQQNQEKLKTQTRTNLLDEDEKENNVITRKIPVSKNQTIQIDINTNKKKKMKLDLMSHRLHLIQSGEKSNITKFDEEILEWTENKTKLQSELKLLSNKLELLTDENNECNSLVVQQENSSNIVQYETEMSIKGQELVTLNNDIILKYDKENDTHYQSKYFNDLTGSEIDEICKEVIVPKNYDKTLINTDLSKNDKKELSEKYSSELDGASVFNRKIDFDKENKKCGDIFNDLYAATRNIVEREVKGEVKQILLSKDTIYHNNIINQQNKIKSEDIVKYKSLKLIGYCEKCKGFKRFSYLEKFNLYSCKTCNKNMKELTERLEE